VKCRLMGEGIRRFFVPKGAAPKDTKELPMLLPNVAVPETSTLSKSNPPAASLPPHLQQINLCHFAGMMERLASYLDSIDAATNHFEKVKAKMEAGSIIEMTSYTEWT
jgi:hypothetical protein